MVAFADGDAVLDGRGDGGDTLEEGRAPSGNAMVSVRFV